MIKIDIQHSTDLEVERIKRTIFRLDWYLSNGYTLQWMSFPKACNTDRLRELSEEEIRAAVDVEYDDGVYLAAQAAMERQFGERASALEAFVSELGVGVISEICVVLTRYGMGGSYSPPNGVIVNIARASGDELVRCVLHETLHLHIEHLIAEHGIGQWEKEGLVELLFDRAFPDLYRAERSRSIKDETPALFGRMFPGREGMLG